MKTTLHHALLCLLAVLLVSCATSAPPQTEAPISDLAGVRLDMPKDEVRSSLASVARLEREERRRQEVWTLTNDPRFASLIVGYTPEWHVRFVTAVAKPDGLAMHYDDVLDTAHAEHRSAGATHTYTWTSRRPAYSVIAIGSPERIAYLSLKELAQQEDDDD